VGLEKTCGSLGHIVKQVYDMFFLFPLSIAAVCNVVLGLQWDKAVVLRETLKETPCNNGDFKAGVE